MPGDKRMAHGWDRTKDPAQHGGFAGPASLAASDHAAHNRRERERRRSWPFGVADAVFEVSRHLLGGAVLQDPEERASVGPYRRAVAGDAMYAAYVAFEQIHDTDLFSVARWFVNHVGIDGVRRALRRHFAKAQEACA